VPGPYPATRRSRRRRSAAGAVAPRPWARGWRRATPGWPGLSTTRGVGELDTNPKNSEIRRSTVSLDDPAHASSSDEDEEGVLGPPAGAHASSSRAVVGTPPAGQ
jgi:hypothetical protein